MVVLLVQSQQLLCLPRIVEVCMGVLSFKNKEIYVKKTAANASVKFANLNFIYTVVLKVESWLATLNKLTFFMPLTVFPTLQF